MAGEMREVAATRLGQLVQAGDAAGLHTALASGEDVHFKDRKGNTYLHYVATMHRPYIIHILVGAGIDVNAQNKYGYSALHVTALQNECGHVADLMASGIDIFLKDWTGKTAAEIKTASKYWHHIYKKYEPGLFQAIREHNVERVRELLHCWCRVDAERGTQTLRQFTAALKLHDLVWILDERKPTLRAIYGVLQCDHKELESALMKSRCDVNYLNNASTMRHILQHALKLQDSKMVSLICAAKADVNIPILISNYIRGPMYFEVINATVPEDIMWTVLKCNPDFSLKDERGRNALIYAMDKCNGKVKLEVLEFLMNHGTSISARDATGATVRDIARFARRKDVVNMIDKYLVKILRGSDMKTLRQLAVECYDSLLIEYNHRDTYIYACGNDTRDVLDFVLWLPTFQKAVRVLHRAVVEGDVEDIRQQLQDFNHPDLLVNAKDRGGRSPLHLAVLFQRLDVLPLLLSHPDLHLNAQDNLFRTALHYAYLLGEEGKQIVKTLRAAGIDSDIVDTCWKKAEDYRGYSKFVEWVNSERKKKYSLAKELLCVDKYEELRKIITHKGEGLKEFYESIRRFPIPIITFAKILRPVMPAYRDLLFLAIDYGRVDIADRIVCLGADLSRKEKYEVVVEGEEGERQRQTKWLTPRQRAEYLGFQELTQLLQEKEEYQARNRTLLQEQISSSIEALEKLLEEQEEEELEEKEQEQGGQQGGKGSWSPFPPSPLPSLSSPLSAPLPTLGGTPPSLTPALGEGRKRSAKRAVKPLF